MWRLNQDMWLTRLLSRDAAEQITHTARENTLYCASRAIKRGVIGEYARRGCGEDCAQRLDGMLTKQEPKSTINGRIAHWPESRSVDSSGILSKTFVTILRKYEGDERDTAEDAS